MNCLCARIASCRSRSAVPRGRSQGRECGGGRNACSSRTPRGWGARARPVAAPSRNASPSWHPAHGPARAGSATCDFPRIQYTQGLRPTGRTPRSPRPPARTSRRSPLPSRSRSDGKRAVPTGPPTRHGSPWIAGLGRRCRTFSASSYTSCSRRAASSTRPRSEAWRACESAVSRRRSRAKVGQVERADADQDSAPLRGRRCPSPPAGC